MAYLDDDFEAWDDEGLSTLTGSNGSYEAWEPAGSGEAVGPRYRRMYPGGAQTRPAAPRPAPPRPVGALGGATLNTPAGRAQVKFDKPLATKESVDALAKELKRDIAAAVEAVKRIDQTVDKNTSILDKKVEALEAILKKGQQGSQMGFLLPLLLTKPPEIESLKFKAASGTETTVNVSDTTYKKDDNFGLLLAVMAMSGGMGGGNDAMNPLMLLALSGGLGGSKK